MSEQSWENITCFCKWKDHKAGPFGYLTTLKDSVKYVIFLRKCTNCGKLRGNFEESKPLPPKEVKTTKPQGVIL